MSRKGKENKLLLAVGEEASKERQQHNGGVITETVNHYADGKANVRRHRAAVECVLDAYCLRECITAEHYQAGLKFRRAYLRAVFRVVVSDQGAGSHGDRDMAALMPIYSEELLQSAYGVLSTQQKAIVVRVCGHDEWAQGKVNLKTLRRGLTRLAEHWGMLQNL